ncbi:unnamed protein product [Chondrus crispus]|uniref:Uncharacterized protein n=1 Tax=Chondrus crispus TaxID=2769 RepID=R7QE38_CHOCR|nr:unnamed protein product [Chondrus crispus]CDF36349.1 unnamed protein product [Chondrus crispus]|eukprot:XP_005716168.1 unnamed protein product [Chondrus crispus]
MKKYFPTKKHLVFPSYNERRLLRHFRRSSLPGLVRVKRATFASEDDGEH